MPRAPRALLACAVGCLLLLGLALGPAASAHIEDYAPYQPQSHCSPKPKAGTVAMAHYLVKHFGGAFGGISRPCKSGGTSEHKEGRAFDWSLDATKRSDRLVAKAFLQWAFAADPRGNEDAKARRMGIMYVIWNDHMYSAWDGFQRQDYLSSSCKKISRCSKTLRHRNHVHISLDRQGGKGLTSWYEGRVDQPADQPADR